MLHKFYFDVFNAYKERYKQKSKTIALVYISFLEISLLLVLGVFFSVFFRQMNVNTMSSEKAWTLFTIASIIIYIKNWLQYSGKKRNIMRAKASKTKTQPYNIWLLWLLPIAFLGLAFVLLQAFV